MQYTQACADNTGSRCGVHVLRELDQLPLSAEAWAVKSVAIDHQRNYGSVLIMIISHTDLIYDIVVLYIVVDIVVDIMQTTISSVLHSHITYGKM